MRQGDTVGATPGEASPSGWEIQALNRGRPHGKGSSLSVVAKPSQDQPQGWECVKHRSWTLASTTELCTAVGRERCDPGFPFGEDADNDSKVSRLVVACRTRLSR